MYTDKYIKRYFSKAREESKKSDYTHNKIGAIVVYKHKIIGFGHNQKVSHPIQKTYNIYRTNENREYNIDVQNNYLHAEIDAIHDTMWSFKGDLSSCSIFVYRETKSGSIGLSKPCNACSHYLDDMCLKNIYYTTDEGWCYERREIK